MKGHAGRARVPPTAYGEAWQACGSATAPVHTVLKLDSRAYSHTTVEGVQLWRVETKEEDRGVEEQSGGKKDSLLLSPHRCDVGGHEGQPDDEGGVDAEGDVARLVEVVGQGAGLKGVVGADDDEEDVVGE